MKNDDLDTSDVMAYSAVNAEPEKPKQEKKKDKNKKSDKKKVEKKEEKKASDTLV